MSTPCIHVISNCRHSIGVIADAAIELEPSVEVIKHFNNDDFLEFFRVERCSLWEIVMTDLVHLSMPTESSRRYLPVVHFNGTQDFKSLLSDAIGTARLFLRLSSGIKKIVDLDDRERTVVMLAADGVPNKSIASRLDVSVKTIEHCRRKAYKKLDVNNSAEVASLITFGKFFSMYDQVAPA